MGLIGCVCLGVEGVGRIGAWGHCEVCLLCLS